MVLAKCLGYAMVVGGALVKLPQIVKIISAASATGLSLPSVVLDLAGVTATTAYNFDQQYPFRFDNEITATFLLFFRIDHANSVR